MNVIIQQISVLKYSIQNLQNTIENNHEVLFSFCHIHEGENFYSDPSTREGFCKIAQQILRTQKYQYTLNIKNELWCEGICSLQELMLLIGGSLQQNIPVMLSGKSFHWGDHWCKWLPEIFKKHCEVQSSFVFINHTLKKKFINHDKNAQEISLENLESSFNILKEILNK